MTDRILIPLPGIGTLELTREEFEARLRQTASAQPAALIIHFRHKRKGHVGPQSIARPLAGLPIPTRRH